MFTHYATVAARAIAKNPFYALINIGGLAVAIAACLLIATYVRFETSYDRWMPHHDEIVQVQNYFRDPTTGDHYDVQGSPFIARRAIAKDFPQVLSSVWIAWSNANRIRDGRAENLENFHFVDGDLLGTFPLAMRRGDAHALDRIGQVILSEAEAIKQFGGTDVIGKTITLSDGGIVKDYQVTGVFADLPKNSALDFRMLARFDAVAHFAKTTPGQTSNWGWRSGLNFFRLKPGSDVAAMNAALPAWKQRNITGNADELRMSRDYTTYAFVPLADVHLSRPRGSGLTPGNDWRSIITLAVVALLVLAMACINFTNLATAQAGGRAREVALRKVLGARRGQLIAQFLGESLMIAGVATLLGLAIAELAMPWFARFMRVPLTLSYLGANGVLLPAVALVLLVGLLGGLYPAFYLSRFQPARILKANKSAAETEGSGRLRTALVIVQFAVSIGLIACTAIVYSQIVYLRSLDPGFTREGLMQLEGIGDPALDTVSDTLVDQIAHLPGVTAVGRTGIGLNTGNTSTSTVFLGGGSTPITLGTYNVDAGYFRTLGVPLLAGRSFDPTRVADDTTMPRDTPEREVYARLRQGFPVVLNESALKRLGIASPRAALGQQLTSPIDAAQGGGVIRQTIVGVVGDARQRGPNAEVEPIIYAMDRHAPFWLLVRYSGDPVAIRGRIETLWKRLAPQVPFDADLAEDIDARSYRVDNARGQMFAAASLLAVAIGCLGLFALASFTAARRTKEIGIRKVLGARTSDIVRLLIWQFTRPVLAANLIAWPLAWWVMRDWLNSFPARITLSPLPFLAAGTLALLIAVATITGQAVRVARAKPIKALRYE